MHWFRLVGDQHIAVPCSLEEGVIFFADHKSRIVAKTEIGNILRISTVFLGLNHNFGSGDPILFETMIFDDNEDGYQTRCSTWAEAEIMHEDAVNYAIAKMAAADISLTLDRILKSRKEIIEE